MSSFDRPPAAAPVPAGVHRRLSEVAELLAYVKPHRVKFGIGIASLLMGSGCVLFFPYLAGGLIDGAMHPGHRAPGLLGTLSLAEMLGVLLGAVFLQGALLTLSTLCTGAVGQRAMAQLRRDLYGRLIAQPMAFFNRRRIGELTNRLSADTAQMETAVIDVLPNACRQGVVMVGGFAMILLTSVKLTLGMLCFVPLVIVMAVRFGRKIRRLSAQTQDRLAETGAIVEETFQAVASVKSYTNEAFEVERYRQASDVVVRAALTANFWRALFMGLMPFVILGSVGVVMWFGARLLQAGEITAGELTRFILYTSFIAGTMAQAADLFTRLQRALGATDRVRELLRETPEVTLAPAATGIGHRAGGEVTFEHVTFRYPARPDAIVLRDVTLRVRPGEKVALVGPSGAGKSTLAALLLRFYEPSSGRILIDGQDARAHSLGWLRQQIALVPQEVLLFGGSIEDNVRYGQPDASAEEVREAARLANAHDFITALPEGYSTLVGDRGVKLSGGQRQRIAIARAILKNPPILVLDEATSSLDSESERLVQIALERLMRGRTTFIVAHRLATIRHADRIVVLEAGEIVEHGTHDELVTSPGGLYRKLSTLQFDDATPRDPDGAAHLSAAS